MKAAELRQSILQAAVQGKLVPQNPQDESASVLLKQIQQEKARLIKDGKIKNEKPLPPILEDEIPYDLPSGWVWCRLNDIYNFIDYRGKTPTKITDGIPLITGANIRQGYMDYSKKWFMSEQEFSERKSRGIPNKGDILFTTEAPLGHVALADLNVFSTGQRIITLQAYLPIISNQLYMFFLLSPDVQNRIIEKRSGMTASGIKAARLKAITIPLPPVGEQQRIISKLEFLMFLCDELEAEEKKLDALEAYFTECLPKSILQEAVQGKLVPQDVHDEPASELLKRIQKEKAQLVKDGKIKEEKPLPSISEDEIPYDLPVGWVWCRTNDICSYIQRGKSPEYSEERIYPVVSQKCVQWDGMDMDKARFVMPKSISKYEDIRLLQTGDLLWNSTGQGTLGRIAVYDEQLNPYQWAVVDSHITILRPLQVLSKYMYFWFAAPEVQSVIEEKATGSTKQIELATSIIKEYIFPLPPMAEQQRIIAKVDELMALCTELKVAYVAPVMSRRAYNIISFPTFSKEKPTLLAARGDVENMSPEALKAMDDLFAEETE